MATMVFHESYGELSRAQLLAYKRYNVSPMDHDDLYRVFGDNHEAIVAIVTDPNYMVGLSFSFYKFMDARLDEV
jgi:hypothetical protein